MNWSCASRNLSQLSFMSSKLRQQTTIVLLTYLLAVELNTWIGNFGCGQPISSRVLRSGTISWAVVNSAANSASAADAITVLITCVIDDTGPLVLGIGSFSETKICNQTQLLDFDSLRKLALECAARVMLLAQYVAPLLGYVAT